MILDVDDRVKILCRVKEKVLANCILFADYRDSYEIDCDNILSSVIKVKFKGFCFYQTVVKGEVYRLDVEEIASKYAEEIFKEIIKVEKLISLAKRQ